MGNAVRVDFGDLVVPQALRVLSGHLSEVEKLAWSRDNRHLVTLDSRFEVRVWDVERGVSIDEFRAPGGTYYAHNAAVALSDDGRRLAYASGGGPTSEALIRDVATHVTLARWELSEGFERLAYVGGRFLLVREELESERAAKIRPTRTVARELIVGSKPGLARVVRAGSNGENGFLTSTLTPDGRLYLWVGPREPPQRRRVEVCEVATGRLVRRIARPAESPFPELSATLDPEGRWFTVDSGPMDELYFDLASQNQLPLRTSGSFFASSYDGRWMAFHESSSTADGTHHLSLRHAATASSWIRFTNDDLSGPGDPRFSRDGRLMAWGSQDGTIKIADLPALEREVRQFEESLIAR
jgi:WD40 repeat protein